MGRQSFFVGHRPHVVGQRRPDPRAKSGSRCWIAENRGPTARWRTAPCRRWAARATARPRSRPRPRGCSDPGTPRRRGEFARAALRHRPVAMCKCSGAISSASAAASSASRTRIRAPNCSRLCRARSPRSRCAVCRASSAAVASSSGCAPGDQECWRPAHVRPGRSGRRP